jgi:cysteine desulfurase/selenocysteine lyase
MTTPTPISEGGGAQTASGILDEGTLARLANEFFAALPGANPSNVPGIAAFGRSGLTSPPAHAATQSAPREPVRPAPASGTPAPDLGTVPGVTALTAPAAPTDYAAALPRLEPLTEPLGFAPLAVPTHPYYFLAESSAYPSALASLPFAKSTEPTLPEGSPDGLLLKAQGFPGDERLHAVLAELSGSPSPSHPNPAQIDNPPINNPGFYFLDPLQREYFQAVPAVGLDAHPLFNVQAVRRDFPILAERVNGQPLIWFDNAATTQKPQAVIDRLSYFYEHENSNIHRAAHELAARATDAYESARSKVARFLGDASSDEIIFVRGATEGINLVAQSWGKANVGDGDEIVLSHLEHHANIVPWQQLAREKGAKIRVIPVDDSGQVLLEEYRKLLNDRTKLVSISQVSNALGTITPVAEIADLAHRAGARVLIDGAQAVSHLRVNVQALQADFYVFSGHKLFAPTGIGAVYGRRELLEAMPPWQGGGNMIDDVTFERTTYQKPPARFEAGTGNIADAAGLGAAIDYVERIGLENISRYEHALLAYATQGMLSVPGLRLIGTARDKASVQSFVLDGYRPEEVGSALNREGIAVRAGHHCAQPILRRFGVEATVRPSFAFYNTCAEIDVMIRALHRLAHNSGHR